MFWLGGFTFYAAVVVPIGREVLGSAQSDVTRHVSFYLNLTAAIALLPLMKRLSAQHETIQSNAAVPEDGRAVTAR